ncbi:MAG TPA: YcxB family protein [Candidatus Acidoferrales bacterium]|nr:YcxB family protein [Candidatus Acidoferrales bacterium]
MHFEYEIPADEFVASQLLYHRLNSGRKPADRAAAWILAGLFFIVVAWSERTPKPPSFLLGVIGAWWIYAGVRNLFPSRFFRRAYRAFEFAGKGFEADVDENGFEVKGDFCDWRVRWPGVRLKGEDDRVFIFTSGGTIFTFGKKYLNSGQQQELRRLSGLKAL